MQQRGFMICQGIVPMLVAAFSVLMWSGCNNRMELDGKDTMRYAVERLSDPVMEGRETGTPGEAVAAQWVDSAFQSLQLLPKGDSASFQFFSYKPHPPMQVHGSDEGTQMGMAVVQEIGGKNVLYANEQPGDSVWGIVGAHYDHLGYGDENSLFRGERQIHHGADDNASGVAGMLELARRLKENEVGHSTLYAAFSGEEKGLWGSNHFCSEPTVPLASVRYMINFDMIGRMRGDTIAIYGTGTSPNWMKLLDQCNEDSLIIVPSESGVGPSDHTSFYLEDIPVLHFFTGQHSDYHKPSDTPEKINVEGMEKVVDLVERLVRELDRQDQWEFTATKDQDEESTPRFNVTLGVIPDYLYSGKGMRIDGVSEGRPAQLSGMERGDIVVSVDTVQVTDMMSYMTALSLFEPGQSSIVVALRNGQPEQFVVQWD